MNKLVMLAAFALLTAVVLGVTGCNSSEPHSQSGGAHTHKYTCSMHPDVVQDTAGKCPKCGMELTEKH